MQPSRAEQCSSTETPGCQCHTYSSGTCLKLFFLVVVIIAAGLALLLNLPREDEPLDARGDAHELRRTAESLSSTRVEVQDASSVPELILFCCVAAIICIISLMMMNRKNVVRFVAGEAPPPTDSQGDIQLSTHVISITVPTSEAPPRTTESQADVELSPHVGAASEESPLWV